MKHHYLFMFLFFCISCAENKSAETEDKTQKLQAVTTGFDPAKSPEYKRVFIGTPYQQNKDTFLIGETLRARVSFDEKVEVLKAVAKDANLDFNIDYNADAINQDKSLLVMPSEDNEYADVKFKVAVKDSSIQYQQMEWRFAITFKFIEKDVAIYDTTFSRSVPYVVKIK
ncbi:hypothetical protein [Nafulsella turpanensis]|uniref:hypothetical protein n=1 Tax=Nafulsella turpanensis TaxID=1265690 RepID=UPI001267A6C6|nr:hypothetical protein [Nafulsella turpanensis]